MISMALLFGFMLFISFIRVLISSPDDVNTPLSFSGVNKSWLRDVLFSNWLAHTEKVSSL